mmetsp:Transcript_86808/g.202012  ORF Transcript_86808/g.202012 Transcript_86808/m.202012 type:complete len:281 (-) Transcript_86808:47-889(-)
MSANGSSTGSAVESSTVVFNVGGQRFEVLRQTIEARPSTLLASLMDDIGTDSTQPMFVDANPDRFAYILDWYRYGEMHLPDGYPLKAILNDARFFLLPDAVKINGSRHALQPPSEVDLSFTAVSTITKDWPTFQQFVMNIIGEVRAQVEHLSRRAAQPDSCGCVDREMTSFRAYFDICDEDGWSDEENVCSQERLEVLVAELEKRGFECEVERERDGLNVFLIVGLQQQSRRKKPSTVRLDGVQVTKSGRLQVCCHHHPGGPRAVVDCASCGQVRVGLRV